MADELLASLAVSSVIYVYVFIADSLIPANWKYRICFPEKMPGYRMFMIKNVRK